MIAGPKIRFFAGAPLLGDGGQPIGMLSIFSEDCRPDFSPFDRRELAGFAAEAMKDLILGAKYVQPPRGLSTQIERNATTGSLTKKSNGTELDNIDGHGLNSLTSSIHSLKQKLSATRLVSNLTTRDNSLQSNSNSFSRFGHRNFDCQDEYGSHKYDQAGDSGPALYKLDALNIGEFAPPSPRPFSSSDVSSIHKHPTNTPVHSQLGFPTTPGWEFSLQLLRSLSRAEYSVNSQEEDGQSLTSRGTPTRLSPRKTTTRTYATATLVPKTASSPRGVPPSPGLSEKSFHSATRPASREDARAQAALICSRTARRLGYDLIYAVELNPSLDAIDETQILQPGVLPMRILAAYGMNEPFRPDPQAHIEALRSKGCYYWQAPRNAADVAGGYQSGCLIGIPTQGGVQHFRTSGIVIGAFRKLVSGRGITFETTDIELRALVDAGNEVKNLFWLTSDSTLRPAPSGTNAELMTEPYPAHEAVQIGQHPLSPFFQNSYAVNRAGNRSESPHSYHTYTHDRVSRGHKPTMKEPVRYQLTPPRPKYRQADQFR